MSASMEQDTADEFGSKWDKLGDMEAILIFEKLPAADQAASRLVCRNWALQGCKSIVASDSTTSKPPRTWTRFAGVERLSLSRCNAYRVDACHMQALQMLRSIRLGPHATDADLQALWPLKATLQTLSLDNRGKLQSSTSHVRRNCGNDVAMVSCRHISDTGVASLSCLPQLTDINFSGCCRLTDASLRTIASNHPRLTSLGTAYCASMTDEGIRHLLQSCTSLKSVNFAGCPLLTEESLACLGACKNLTNVKLSRCQLVTDAAIKAISGLHRLESLSIARCSLVTDAGLNALESATSLKTLEMPGCSDVSDIGLQSLSALTQLCRLNIAALVRVTDAGLDALSGLSLTSVNLSSLPNITAAPLAGLAAITSCTLTRCPSVASLEPLQMLTRLQSLEIGHPAHAMPECTETLALLPGLVRLSVSSASRPSASGAKLLHALSNLSLIEELSLPAVRIDPEDFADAVRNWPLLQSLKIASRDLSEATIAIVPQLPSLRKLQISSGRLMSESSMEGIAGICDLDDLAIHECAPAAVSSGVGLSCLQSLPLTSLDLSNCRALTDNMLAALDPVDTLRQLCLAGCISLRGTGLSNMSCASHLKILSCRRTGFCNEAAEKLVTSMHRLQNLDISECCYITNEAGEQLSVLTGLTCLNLIGCASLQEDTIQLIVSCMPGTEVLYNYAM